MENVFCSRLSRRRGVVKIFTGESRTEACHKNSCDISRIIRKHGLANIVASHSANLGHFGDFSNITDYQSAMNAVIAAQNSFDSLPAKLRSRFNNNPADLLSFLSDDANRDEAISLGILSAHKEPSGSHEEQKEMQIGESGQSGEAGKQA